MPLTDGRTVNLVRPIHTCFGLDSPSMGQYFSDRLATGETIEKSASALRQVVDFIRELQEGQVSGSR
jgi:hypothetical protein